MIEIKEGDIVLCTVTKIVGTSVFVQIENNWEGSIVTSEIASGRIRNLRDYVVPNKRIVCKVLRVIEGRIDLSLRRVTAKERDEVLERHEKEKSSLSILKSVLGDKAEEIAGKIRKKEGLYDFLQNCKVNPEKLKEHLSLEQAERVCKILQEKREKEKIVKQGFSLKSNFSDGVVRIKEALKDFSNVNYFGAGNYMLTVKASNFKEANLNLKKILDKIEERADKLKLDFEVKK